MNATIEGKLPDIRALCAKYGVRKLSVFGSATSDQFDPSRSDVDVLVEFQPMPPAQHADAYFGLVAELERLFGRPVDLVEAEAIDNPYFQRAVERSKTVLYDAA